MAYSKIKFPVLRKLGVAKYQLFPGDNHNGLTQDFLPGVTVIVGINGLGKTTLLNIILRLLTGANEPKKFDPYDPGGGVHEMVTKDVQFFAQRVLDNASDATATGEFSFGDDSVVIERRLKDLFISSLEVNGVKQSGDQESLQNAIVHVSGAGDEYDFFYIVRSFTFFLEDKVSLIWNPKGQFEVFRILFFDPAEAQKFAQLQDEVQRIDSDYRNRRVSLNRRKKELRTAYQRKAGAKDLLAKVSKAEAELEALQERRKLDETKEEELAKTRATCIVNRERLHLDLEEAMRAVESLVESYFFSAFPAMPDAVKLLLTQLTSRGGCLVCGNEAPKYPAHFRELAAKGVCPFCNDDTTKRSSANPLRRVRAEQVNNAETRLQELQDARDRLDDQLAIADQELATHRKQQGARYESILKVQGELERLRMELPLDKRQYDAELGKLRPEGDDLRDLGERLRSRRASFQKILGRASKTIEKITVKLSARFSFYAGEFLAETCKLAWEPSKQRVGQEGEPFDFPSFTIYMTSAVSVASPTARHSEAAVSESQKEFVDLAFRMALFDVVTEGKVPVMLVIETPESSLDSVFVERAGQLLRKFASSGGRKKNTVIATSNLNRENMIRALLGLDEKPSEATRAEVQKRIVNLLSVAAPNAALRQNEQFYLNELARATKV